MNYKLSQLVPFFNDCSSEVESKFRENAIVHKLSKGQFIVIEGGSCNYLPIVISGIVRVYKHSSSGHEMTLYRIKSGESCVLTISCILTSKEFPAVAYTESETEIILIDAKIIKNWVNKYPIWREYIFNYLSNILIKVLTLLENTTFNRTEIRIIDFLISSSEEHGFKLVLTHQQIAGEIGTSREVVSRILKELETEKLIGLSRGSIIILQIEILKKRNLVIH